MYNLIKMDLYRLLHATSTKVLVFVVACFSVFVVVMTNMDIESMKNSSDETQMENVNNDEIGTTIEDDSISMNFGIYSETRSEWETEDIVFADFVETQVASALFLIVLSIFVSLYVYAERKQGFIKNFAGQLTNKWFLVISKLVAVAVMNLLMFVVLAIVMYIAGKIVFGEQLLLGSVIDLLKVLGGQYLLHMGFASLILAMNIIFNSSDMSITLGILLSCRVMTLLYVPMSRLKFFDDRDFEFTNYAIEMNVTSFSLSAKQADIVRAMVVAVVFIIVSGILAAVVMQNRDVK